MTEILPYNEFRQIPDRLTDLTPFLRPDPVPSPVSTSHYNLDTPYRQARILDHWDQIPRRMRTEEPEISDRHLSRERELQHGVRAGQVLRDLCRR